MAAKKKAKKAAKKVAKKKVAKKKKQFSFLQRKQKQTPLSGGVCF